MAGRRAKLLGLILLALAGCEHLDALRQGVLSTYCKELRRLGEELDRQEMAKLTATDEESPGRPEVASTAAPVVSRVGWQAAPLTGAVHLRPPVPLSSP
jgi:hypothetical protein